MIQASSAERLMGMIQNQEQSPVALVEGDRVEVRETAAGVSTNPARLGIEDSGGYRPEQPRSPLARWSVRHRWLVVLSSLLVLVAGVAVTAGVGIATLEQGGELVGDSAAAEDIMDGADFGDVPTEYVIVTDPAGPLAPEDAADLTAELSMAYDGVTGVVGVGEAFPGADGSLVVPLEMVADDDGVAVEPGPAVAATQEMAQAHPDLEIGQFGEASLDDEVNETIGEDFVRAEIFSIPVTLIILLLAFGAVVAAGVPLVLGLGSVAVALGLTAIVSTGLIPVDPNSQSLVLLIGLAVGVDYALFVLRRAREERHAGATVEDSIAIAGGTAGRAVAISGLTVVIAMSGMLVAGGMFTSLGLGAMLVVGAAVLAATITLPAILAILGDKVEALRLPFTRRREARRGSVDTFWGRLAGQVTKRPLAWAVTVGALLVALASPALGMKTATGGIETLPQDLASVRAYHQFHDAVPADESGALQVVVRAPAGSAADVEAALLASGDTAGSLDLVSAVDDSVQVSADGTVSVWNIGLQVNSSDEAMPDVVDQVRAQVLPEIEAALADVPDAAVHLGGAAAVTDLTSWMDGRLPWVVGFVLALTLIVMTLSFGSPALALATVALNALSVGAAYGILTAVFGGTWAEGLLDFNSTGAIASWLPLMLFVLLFGLSMDYHIFVTSRVREARDGGASPREAIRVGLARSAGVVTAAAAVMVGVFSIFGTLSILEMKQLGVGLAAAVLLDATVVRGIMLPALLGLLGDRAHTGPSWLPRLHH
ncbi:MMPL family transporter [Ornithinicoccus hortensis]|uniref:RND superfamily putative drug exporter n=1 Tax=Ornithinicoccus hortensis TaxID=82346 RepID=A0A542YNR4_9MICO|nr:MMPL family transporter [Ornithinicoccus hortensis]TQL49740.1 RND superfamily putative drug exporter [Ornithinicoccus hortensis]